MVLSLVGVSSPVLFLRPGRFWDRYSQALIFLLFLYCLVRSLLHRGFSLVEVVSERFWLLGPEFVFFSEYLYVLLANTASLTTVSYSLFCQSAILRSRRDFTSLDFLMSLDFCSIADMKTITFSEFEFLWITLLISVVSRSIIFFPVLFFGRVYFLFGRFTISFQYSCQTLSSCICELMCVPSLHMMVSP